MKFFLDFLKLLYSDKTENSPISFPIFFALRKQFITSKQSSIDKLKPCPARGCILCAASPINSNLFSNGDLTYFILIGYVCNFLLLNMG